MGAVAMRLALACGLIPVSGCYFYFSTPKKAEAPTVVPGEPIVVKTKRKTAYFHCVEPYTGCYYAKDGIWKKEAEYDDHVVTYRGKQLTRGELRALADPEGHAERYKKIDANRGTCKLSLIPSALSMAGLLTVIVGGVAYKKLGEDTGNIVVGVGMISTVGFGVLSYPIGGYACRRMDHESGRMGAAQDDLIGVHAGVDNDAQQQQVAEIMELVEAFNARVDQPSGGEVSSTAEPATETSSTDAPTAAEPGRDDTPPTAMKTASADACTQRLVDNGHVTDAKKAAKLCEKHTPEQIAKAEALVMEGVTDSFSRLVGITAKHTDAEIECAKREWAADRAANGHRAFSVKKQCRQ